LPFTALCYIILQLLLSHMCSHLAYQPLTMADAWVLDTHIAHCIHDYLSFPFHFDSFLLFLPLDCFGFVFSSIAHINASVMLSGVQYDLNHFILPFQQMAHITLNDWTCSFNGCHHPFSSCSLSHPFRAHTFFPVAWCTVWQVLSSLYVTGYNFCSFFFTFSLSFRGHVTYITCLFNHVTGSHDSVM
ncbi:hypothetical protein F5I97DRAFT_1810578, partial [Phlebopus sp. FC_14]